MSCDIAATLVMCCLVLLLDFRTCSKDRSSKKLLHTMCSFLLVFLACMKSRLVGMADWSSNRSRYLDMQQIADTSDHTCK